MKPHFSIKPNSSAFADITIHESDVESVMREAAFVSSEGKVYRLFSENEKPALGSHLTLPASPFVKETAEDCQQFEIFCPSAKEELFRAAILLEQSTKEQKEFLPLDKTFKNMRAVEGICGRNQKPASPLLFLSPQEQSRSTASKELPLEKKPAEKKQIAIPLTQFTPLELPKELLVPQPSRRDTTTLIHLTTVKLPETLRKRCFGIPFRKKKSVPKTFRRYEIPVENETQNNEKHHLPAETENQITAAFLAAGEEFRTNAAAVWSARVDSLEERALEQIKKLSLHLIELHKQGKRIISFNSFFSGEGCTTVAACAAKELAAQGYYILLADTNEHHPELTSQFSSLTDPDIYGIIQLEDKLHFLPFSDAMIESETDGKPVTQRFTQLIAAMKEDYDFILLDNGGLSEHRLEERVQHWNEMASDGVLLVLKQQNIQRINVSAVSGRLQQHRIDLAGIAENYVPAV